MEKVDVLIDRCRSELSQVLSILRSVEFKAIDDEGSYLPQSFDFAVQRIEGVNIFLDHVAMSIEDKVCVSGPKELWLPLEISRKNLCGYSEEIPPGDEVEIF
jgi:hypothetical protein